MTKLLTIFTFVLTITMLVALMPTGTLADTELTAIADPAGESLQLPDPLQAGWKGEPVCEKLLENAQNRILRCTFPPGVGHERHYHQSHFGYALSGGQMRLTDANGVREVDLTTDTSYSSDGVDWHEVLNIGTTTVTYLIVEQK